MGGSMPVNRCFPCFVMRLHPWAVTLPDLKRPPSLHAQAPQRRLIPGSARHEHRERRVPAPVPPPHARLLRTHSATIRSATAAAPTTLPNVTPLSAWRRHRHVTTPPVPATHAPPARVAGMVREKSRRQAAHGLNRNGNDAAHRRKFDQTAHNHMTRRSARLIQTARRKPPSPCGSGFSPCCS